MVRANFWLALYDRRVEAKDWRDRCGLARYLARMANPASDNKYGARGYVGVIQASRDDDYALHQRARGVKKVRGAKEPSQQEVIQRAMQLRADAYLAADGSRDMSVGRFLLIVMLVLTASGIGFGVGWFKAGLLGSIVGVLAPIVFAWLVARIARFRRMQRAR